MSDIKGYFASSKAGHDKGTVYMILESDDVYVYLSDGKLRPTDKLKKKIFLACDEVFSNIVNYSGADLIFV